MWRNVKRLQLEMFNILFLPNTMYIKPAFGQCSSEIDDDLGGAFGTLHTVGQSAGPAKPSQVRKQAGSMMHGYASVVQPSKT